MFVPDVLANILIISSVPFAYYLLGSGILPVLFLLNACLNYAIYALPSMHNEKVLEHEKYCIAMIRIPGKFNRTNIQTWVLVFLVLPVFGLLLGQSYVPPKHRRYRFEAIFLYILVFIIPIQVSATIIQGTGFLTPYLYIFSIYQHLQYLPIIFLGLYFLALVSLYKHQDMRRLLLFLAPFIGVYTAASISLLALLMVLICAPTIMLILVRSGYGRFSLLLVTLIAVFLFAYIFAMKSHASFAHTFNWSFEQGAPLHTQDHIHYWKMYFNGILKNAQSFMLGHEQAPGRDVAPSSYNYYLDLVYNFGFIALLPFIFLIWHTLRKLYPMIHTTTVSPDFIVLSALVLFFVLIDNSFKVGFRQPYPGIIMFFLCGVLLSRLSITANNS